MEEENNSFEATGVNETAKTKLSRSPNMNKNWLAFILGVFDFFVITTLVVSAFCFYKTYNPQVRLAFAPTIKLSAQLASMEYLTPVPVNNGGSQPKCSEGFLLYDGDFFSVCYPVRMQLERRDLIESELLEESILVRFESPNGKEGLKISSDFLGGLPEERLCEFSRPTIVSGYSAVRFVKTERNETECGEITTFNTYISVPQKEQSLYAITYGITDGTFYDFSEYNAIEQSLKIKKF